MSNIYKKIVIGFFAIILLAPQYHGWDALGDEFATWKNGGFPSEDARLAVAFDIDVKNREKK